MTWVGPWLWFIICCHAVMWYVVVSLILLAWWPAASAVLLPRSVHPPQALSCRAPRYVLVTVYLLTGSLYVSVCLFVPLSLFVCLFLSLPSSFLSPSHSPLLCLSSFPFSLRAFLHPSLCPPFSLTWVLTVYLSIFILSPFFVFTSYFLWNSSHPGPALTPTTVGGRQQWCDNPHPTSPFTINCFLLLSTKVQDLWKHTVPSHVWMHFIHKTRTQRSARGCKVKQGFRNTHSPEIFLSVLVSIQHNPPTLLTGHTGPNLPVPGLGPIFKIYPTTKVYSSSHEHSCVPDFFFLFL